jgi:hypothetical protein
MFPVVSDVDIAGAVHGHTPGIIQKSVGSRATIAQVALMPISGDGRDLSVGCDFTNDVLFKVRDVHIAGVVRGNAKRGIQLGAGPCLPISCIALGAVSGNRGDGRNKLNRQGLRPGMARAGQQTEGRSQGRGQAKRETTHKAG